MAFAFSGQRERRAEGPRSAWAFCLSLALASTGCATYQGKVSEARALIGSRQTEKAIEALEPLASKGGDDQLVYMLDYGVALQQAGRFKESSKTFVAAERISDIQDYTSLSKQAASLLASEEMVQYRGDDYEKVLINAVNAINFLMMNDLESALVEVRRLNNKLHLYRSEAKRPYEQNPFAFYLGAVIWEADRKYDDAYIAYKKAYELIPDYAPLREDLVRAAIRAQRLDDVGKWKALFPEVRVRPEWTDPTLGELVFIYQQGWGPRKTLNPQSPRFPKLSPVSSLTTRARIEIAPVAEGAKAARSADTHEIFSVRDVAIKTLDDQYGALIAKRVAGVAAKAVVADQIRQKNQALGDVAWLVMNLSDRADLRQWSTLPETFQIARAYLKAGKYSVGVKGLSSSGAESGEDMESREVDVRAGRKTFLTWRSFR